VGAASDATIPFQSGVLYDFKGNVALLTDKIYRGNHTAFLSPISGHLFNLTPKWFKKEIEIEVII
jgi:hypothetical protein